MTEVSPSPVAGDARPPVAAGRINPIIPGFFPDPTVCRVGDEYFLATSSFEYFPGAPLFHSDDLLRWTQIGHAFTRSSQFRQQRRSPSTGIYGSTLRFHDGRFWLITTNVSDFTSGQVIVSTTDPAGAWSEPVWVSEAVGIDPDLCWDDDGTCYLTWNALDFQTGGRGIRQAPIDPATGALLGADYPVWQGTGLVAPEGPHLYKIGRYWYQMLAEGGTERGHCVTIARSLSPRGPFEACPWNPVFTHRSTAHPVQNVGHADLVEAPDGSWAAVYLGVRPHGSTPGFHVLGRETFIASVDWVDGWPVFDEGGFDFRTADTGFTDSFGPGGLHHRWVTPTGALTDAGHLLADGGMALSAEPEAPLSFRVRDLQWTAEAVLEGSGSFMLRLDNRHWYALSAANGAVSARVRIGEIEHTIATADLPPGPVTLRLRSEPPRSRPLPFGHAGPDDIVLEAGTADFSIELARLDGRYLSTEVAGGFTGRMLGVAAEGEGTVLRSVRYEPSTAA